MKRPVQAHLDPTGRLHTISKSSRRSANASTRRSPASVLAGPPRGPRRRLEGAAAGRGTSVTQVRARLEAKRRAAQEAADAAT